MNKRKIIFILSILFVLSLLFVIYYLYTTDKVNLYTSSINDEQEVEIESENKDNSNKKNNQKELQELRIIDAGYYDKALESKDSLECDKINSIDIKNNCYQNVAIQIFDFKLCDKLNGEFEKKACLFLVFQRQSIKSKDIKYCDDIINVEQAERCKKLFRLAENTSFCDTEKCINKLYEEDKKKDTDNDGLSDYEEKIIYNTDFKKQDTDGDGYFDGDEVRDGFDPNDNGELNNELN